MALWYTGPRPVTKGRNADDAVHTWKGTVGEYSNWSIFNTSNVLDGAPNEDHVPGTGRHPHGLQMSRWFTGLDDQQPLDDPGVGPRPEGYRYRPLEFKGLEGAKAFKSTFGHTDRDSEYSLFPPYKYLGVESAEQLVDVGHSLRGIDAEGTANSFGRFAPHSYQGISSAATEDPGEPLPEGYDNPYGKNKVLEWQGVPSAKAL